MTAVKSRVWTPALVASNEPNSKVLSPESEYVAVQSTGRLLVSNSYETTPQEASEFVDRWKDGKVMVNGVLSKLPMN
jgi:hypothetical protein